MKQQHDTLREQIDELRAELERLRTVVPISQLPKGEPAHVLVYRRNARTSAVEWVDMGMTALSLDPEYVYALPIPTPLRHPTCPKILEYPEAPSPQARRKRPPNKRRPTS